MAKEGGFHSLGVKPESLGKPKAETAEAKPYYPSMHIGHKAGVDLPAGEHEFHIKASVGKTIRQAPGQDPEVSHELQVTHIKHLKPVGATKSATEKTDGLDEALGKIEKQKLGAAPQAAEQHDASA